MRTAQRFSGTMGKKAILNRSMALLSLSNMVTNIASVARLAAWCGCGRERNTLETYVSDAQKTVKITFSRSGTTIYDMTRFDAL